MTSTRTPLNLLNLKNIRSAKEFDRVSPSTASRAHPPRDWRQSDTSSLLSNHVWIICHLSRPLDWKSRNGDRASCSSKKNFNVSLPVGPPESMGCLWSQRSHSRIIRVLASVCLISARHWRALRAHMVALVYSRRTNHGGSSATAVP